MQNVSETRTLSDDRGVYSVTVLVYGGSDFFMAYLEREEDGVKSIVSDNPLWIDSTLLPALKYYLLHRNITEEVEEFLNESVDNIYSLLVILETAKFLGWFEK